MTTRGRDPIGLHDVYAVVEHVRLGLWAQREVVLDAAAAVVLPRAEDAVFDAAAEVGFPTDRLELEITERALASDPDRIQLTLARLREAGISIWLKAELAVLMKRVMRRDNRPLLKHADPEARMRELMDLRYPIYAQADLTLHTREVPHAVIVGELITALLEGPLHQPTSTPPAPESPPQ